MSDALFNCHDCGARNVEYTHICSNREVSEILSTPLVGALNTTNRMRYVAIRKSVMCGQNCAVPAACSHEMAKRIARLLNEEEENR